jgi:Acyl-CoA dehydrogenases
MDFNFTQDENDFRQEIKDWLSENLSQRISNKVKKFQRLNKNDYEEFMKALSDEGWLAVNWPKEHGKAGWSNTQKHILKKR